jgi:hypothetical protein
MHAIVTPRPVEQVKKPKAGDKPAPALEPNQA